MFIPCAQQVNNKQTNKQNFVSFVFFSLCWSDGQCFYFLSVKKTGKASAAINQFNNDKQTNKKPLIKKKRKVIFN